jgi:hypothetical protein
MKMVGHIVVETDTFRAEYAGGPYIDLIDPQSGDPYDCINVWDYDRDEPTIEFTIEAVMRVIADLEADDSRLDPEGYR